MIVGAVASAALSTPPALIERAATRVYSFSNRWVRGAVNGGRFYGTAPVVANNGPDDVGQGRLLPSTGVDQYAATLGKWFGISDTDLLTVLPNLGHYDASQRNLGFV